jgi:ribulose-5-phosphate 4-epimerase/fuculose-1-phosphate aldolase
LIQEGVIKFNCEWTKGPPLDSTAISELNKWRRSLFDAGLVGQYADTGIGFGNVSRRTGPDPQFIITGTQTGHIADLTGAHFAEITDCDISENVIFCRGPVRASSESLTHAAIYELDPEIQAVVHVHSDKLWRELRDKIPTTSPNVAYGTPEMAREFRRLYRDTDFGNSGIAVMGGHDGGLISIGHDMAEATGKILEVAASVRVSGDK